MNERKLPAKNHLPYEYKIPSKKQSIIKSKSGDIIKFKYKTDIEYENRGWVLNELTMYINGLESGYLKMSYIPEKHWDYYKGDLIKWMIQHNIITINNNNNIIENSREYKIQICKNNSIFFGENELEKMDEEKLNYEYKKHLKFLNKKYGEEYKKEKIYFIDKPLIDFSKIYDITEMIENNYPELEENLKENYKTIIFNEKMSKLLKNESITILEKK